MNLYANTLSGSLFGVKHTSALGKPLSSRQPGQHGERRQAAGAHERERQQGCSLRQLCATTGVSQETPATLPPTPISSTYLYGVLRPAPAPGRLPARSTTLLPGAGRSFHLLASCPGPPARCCTRVDLQTRRRHRAQEQVVLLVECRDAAPPAASSRHAAARCTSLWSNPLGTSQNPLGTALHITVSASELRGVGAAGSGHKHRSFPCCRRCLGAWLTVCGTSATDHHVCQLPALVWDCRACCACRCSCGRRKCCHCVPCCSFALACQTLTMVTAAVGAVRSQGCCRACPSSCCGALLWFGCCYCCRRGMGLADRRQQRR